MSSHRLGLALLSSVPACSARQKATPVLRLGKRYQHDLTIKQKDGRPILRSGPGGRHSFTGHVATVFGCTGFLGRYLVHKLAKKGTQVIIPYRDEDEKRHLKVMGDLGQIVPMEWDIRNDSQIEEAVRHSDVVYNLVGRDYETKNFKFHEVHIDGARRIASIAQLAGVSRLIHVSHLNADPDSPSAVLRCKAEGEEAVKNAFPSATIVRPGWMYGHEDRLLNTLAVYPFIFRINDQQTVIKPVHVLDVAEAMAIMLDAESTAGQTFSLPGPQEYTYEQLIALAESRTYTKLQGANLPKWAMSLMTRVWENVWWPTLSPDEITRRFLDDKDNAAGTLSWDYLGMTPDQLADLSIVYFRRYRSSAYHDIADIKGLEGYKLRQSGYHTIE